MVALQTAARPHASLSPGTLVALASALVATAVLAAAALSGSDAPLGDRLGDPDDALRLVGVRELIASGSWFDTTLPRVGAPEPLLSHWSRLIDLPLALFIRLLSPIAGAGAAEIMTRAIWPLLLFFLLVTILAREADRRAGPWAAAFTAVLAVLSIFAIAQFRPGRIDHHNAQILCAVAGLVLLVRSLDDWTRGWSAGVWLGLGLAIGYEAIALVVPALGLAALLALMQPRAGRGVVRAAAGATAVLCAAFLITIPPARWLDIRCDALALNVPILAAFSTLGLWLACRSAAGIAYRLAIAGGCTAIGVALFAFLEPACLAGPFGQVDPALGPIWLSQVSETKSIVWFIGRHPTLGLAELAFLLAAAAVQIVFWTRRKDRGTTLATAIVLLALALACWQMKLVPYASWLAILPLAIFCAGLEGTASISAPIVRIGAVLLMSQVTLDAGFNAVRAVLPIARPMRAATVEETGDPRRPCFASSNVARLAVLEPGLIAADIDLGPYIVALTPHRVVAAPYHRLSRAILADHAILDGPFGEARARIDALGVTAVALCNDTARVGKADPPGTLRGQLLAGAPVGFLEEITPPDAPIRAWRVRDRR